MVEPIGGRVAGQSAADVAGPGNMATAAGSGACPDGLEQQAALLGFPVSAAVHHDICDATQAAAAAGADSYSWAVEFDPLGLRMPAHAQPAIAASVASRQQLQHTMAGQQPQHRASAGPYAVDQTGLSGSEAGPAVGPAVPHAWPPPLEQSDQDLSPEQLQQLLVQGLSAPLCQVSSGKGGPSTGGAAEPEQPCTVAASAPPAAATSPPTMESAGQPVLQQPQMRLAPIVRGFVRRRRWWWQWPLHH